MTVPESRRVSAASSRCCSCSRASLALVAAPPADARATRAVLAFLPTGGDDNPDPVLDRLDARPAARDRARQRDPGPLLAGADAARHHRRVADLGRRLRLAPAAAARARRRRRRQRLRLRLEQGARARGDGARGDRARPAGEPYPGRRAHTPAWTAASNLEAVGGRRPRRRRRRRLARAVGGPRRARAPAVDPPPPRRRRAADRRQGRRRARPAAARPPPRRRADRRADRRSRRSRRSFCRPPPRCRTAATAC